MPAASLSTSPPPSMQPHQLVRKTVALVLAGGRGSTLDHHRVMRAQAAGCGGG